MTSALQYVDGARLRFPVTRPSKLIFLHAPKAAGGTFNQFLRAQCRQTGLSYFRVSGHAYRHARGISQRLAMENLKPTDADVVAGHFHYGVHTSLGYPESYIALLRDPIKRVLSQFNFWAERGKLSESEGFLEVVNADIMDNLQTRQLAGSFESPCTQATFDLAARNLDRCAFVGVSERLSDFILLVNLRMGWPSVEFSDRHRSSAATKSTLTDAERSAIEERELWDIRLHRLAAERFARDWAASTLLRHLNRAAGFTLSAFASIRAPLRMGHGTQSRRR